MALGMDRPIHDRLEHAMSADCPGCWPTPKLPITRVPKPPPPDPGLREDSKPIDPEDKRLDHAD